MARAPHPWWQHLPASERRGRGLRVWWLRWTSRLARRRSRILLLMLLYAGLCLLPLLIGQAHLSALALLPLLLVPAVGWLAYALAWHEFHR